MTEPATDLLGLVRECRDEILRLADEHGARRLRLFGSIARGEAVVGSDLDILVEMDEGRSLLDRVALQQDLESLLGIEVDVVTEKALHPMVRPRILEEAVEL